MKNLPVILVTIFVVIAVLFTLITSGNKDNKLANKTSTSSAQNTNKEDKVSTKEYSKVPDVLPEAERIGKKALFETTMGNFTISLYGDKAPKTVSSFIVLARDGFYDNLTFHRVIADFMIQGGDPLGTGTGGPGYKFEDEIDSSLTFNKPGLLAMANSGPNTNGSQFFITVTKPDWLNGKHTIFGEVTDGYENVVKISKAEKDANDKPLTPIVIKKITIE